MISLGWPTHWSVCEVIVTLAFLAGGLIAGTLILAALTLTAADVLGLCRR